jgi:hypothetical protein
MRKDFSSQYERMEKALNKLSVFYRILIVLAMALGVFLCDRFTGDWAMSIGAAIGCVVGVLLYVAHTVTKQAN